MKKISIIFSFLLAAFAASLHAQTCSTGFCPASITVHHKAGNISPVTGDITYNVSQTNVFGAAASGYCILDRNLGVTTLPTNSSDYANGAGWYFQFGRPRGWTTTTTSANLATWVNNVYATPGSSWSSTNDPCNAMLGGAWRLPTLTEATAAWNTLSTATAFANWKISTTGTLDVANGALTAGPVYLYMWTATYQSISSGYLILNWTGDGTGLRQSWTAYNQGCTVRCIKYFAN